MNYKNTKNVSPVFSKDLTLFGGPHPKIPNRKNGKTLQRANHPCRFSATSMALRIVTLLPPAAGYPAHHQRRRIKKIDDDLFMESWKQVHHWIKLIEPLTRCGKPSIETVVGCRQLMLLLEKWCRPAATGKTWDFGGHLWVCNFLGNLWY